MAQTQQKIRKGQIWRKRDRFMPKGSEPFYLLILGNAGGSHIKTKCSNGTTHSILPFIIKQKFELVEQ